MRGNGPEPSPQPSPRGSGGDDAGALELSPEAMRALGYRVVDMLVEHLVGLREKPVTRRGTRREIEARLREPAPAQGSDPAAVLERLEREVFGNLMHLDHPRFFAFVPGPGNFVGAMADALASGFNVFAATWLEASGPAEVELVTLDWLRQLCGLPETAGGLFVSGGSAANLTALAVARHVKLDDRIEGAVVYGSDQTHSSVERGLRVLGFAPGQLRRLPSDEGYRLDPAVLRRAISEDRAAGRVPFCVVANAGTTNTGAVDPLPELAALCREEGLWLHADGAYGAAAVLCDAGRARLKELESVDSLALDPHKWLFQPYEIGCVLLRDRRLLKETFRILPEYLRDADRSEEEVNFCDYGVQLTRGFRALKLWLSIQVFGLDAFREAVARGFALAESAERALGEAPCWQVVTPAQLGIVTFRWVPPGPPMLGGVSAGTLEDKLEALNAGLVEAMVADGFAMVSSTVLRGRTVLRMCTINPRTTESDVRETIERLGQLAADLWHSG
jgi:aromatic-L-amino-acid decarboxylase